ncbi:DUF317 domain-containing protein [Streptomyces sp. CA-250714]|uniref:DUF317 domain-containing protein n=1 Tax=Streptomyces sp. CA-250714 TaxID=3240060 RepID=UPI003D8E5A78
MRTHAEPSYLIAPLHLAGPDVTVKVLSNRWQARPYRDTCVYVHRSEGQLVEALHNPHGGRPACEHGRTTGREPEGGWEFTARHAPGAPRTWRALFAPATPPELPAAFAHAVTRLPTMPGPLIHAEPTSPLGAAEWICDRGTRENTWFSTDGQAIVITPPHSHKGRPNAAVRSGGPALPDTGTAPGCDAGGDACTERWLFAAQHSCEQQLLWFALVDASTPNALLRALCKEIAREEPVPRNEIPGPDTGPVLVHRLR